MKNIVKALLMMVFAMPMLLIISIGILATYEN